MDCDGLTVSTDARKAYVCACMRLTHADLVNTLAEQAVATLTELRRQTGAGDGCMACHRRLQCYLAQVGEATR